MVKPGPNPKQVVITVQDSVFTSPELVPRFEMKSDNVQEYMEGLLSDSDMKLGKKIKKLKNLYLVLLTFMMDEPMEQELVNSLSGLEKQLLVVFLRKKRVKNYKRATATVEFMECARKCPVKRGKAEKSYKFVLNKVMAFLREIFRDKVYPFAEYLIHPHLTCLPKDLKLDFAFHGYYFGQASRDLRKRIECFFYPEVLRRHNLCFNSLVFKSVSNSYIDYVRRSPMFIIDVGFFLQNCLIRQANSLILNKIRKLVTSWEKHLVRFGVKSLGDHLKSKFIHNPKKKLAWSVQEVRLAATQLWKVIK